MAVGEVEVQVTIGYSDDTKKKFSIGTLKPNTETVRNLKNSVMEINRDWDSVYNLSSILQNEDGASATRITAAGLTLESDTKINLSSETFLWQDSLRTEYGSDTGSTQITLIMVDGNGKKLSTTYNYINPAAQVEEVDHVGRALAGMSTATYQDTMLIKAWSTNEEMADINIDNIDDNDEKDGE